MTKYICRGPDEEDLTEAIREKVEARPTSIFRLRKPDKRRRRGEDSMRVVVFCSEGHENIFEVKRDEL